MLKGQEASSHQRGNGHRFCVWLPCQPSMNVCFSPESQISPWAYQTDQPPSVALRNPPNVLRVRVWKGHQGTPGPPMPKPTPSLILASPLLVCAFSLSVSLCLCQVQQARYIESLRVFTCELPSTSGGIWLWNASASFLPCVHGLLRDPWMGSHGGSSVSRRVCMVFWEDDSQFSWDSGVGSKASKLLIATVFPKLKELVCFVWRIVLIYLKGSPVKEGKCCVASQEGAETNGKISRRLISAHWKDQLVE